MNTINMDHTNKNESQINSILDQLDAMITKDNMNAELKAFGEVCLFGNKESLLRLGLEIMKAAYSNVPENADYVFSNDTEFYIDHITTDRDYFNTIST